MDYDYTIELPDDWTRKREGKYSSPSPQVHLEITSHRFPAGADIGQYIQQVQDNLKEDWEDWWFTTSLFDTTSVEKETTDEKTAIRIRYRVQETSEYCVLDVVDVVLVSLIVPEDPQVFRIRAWMCESSVARRGQLRDDVLKSFEVITKPAPAPYYTQFLYVKGVQVRAHESVDPAALQAGAEIVDAMLSGREDIPGCMAQNGGDFAIIPRDQFNTDLPEFADLKGTKDWTGRSRDTFDIRGLGGIGSRPSTAGEEQLLGNWGPEHPWYPYRGLVATHEYAHGIQNQCFTQEDWEKWNGFYDEAVEQNWYPGTHMMADVFEFFAVFSTAYFEVTYELGDDPSREEIRNRFPEIFQALDEIYGGATLPEIYRVKLPHPQ